MDFKKISRNPLIYVALIVVLLIVGFSLMSSLSGAKQITTEQGLTLLKGDTVTKVTNTDGDQVVNMTLSAPYQGSEQVQFYYVAARAPQVMQAIDAANPSGGYNDIVPKTSWFSGFLSIAIPMVLLACCSGSCCLPRRAAAARSCSSGSRGRNS